MKEETKKEKVFSIHITLFDVAVMILSSTLAIVVLGTLIIHDIFFGVIVALVSIAWTLVTRCMTFNPNKYREWEDDIEEEPEQEHNFDWITSTFINMITLFLGMLMANEASLNWVSKGGEVNEIFDFGDMNHIDTVGWLMVFMSLYFMFRRPFLWIKDKIRGER